MAARWQASGALLGALTTADVTPVNPTHAANDILICITSHRSTTPTCLTPSGWNLLYGPEDTTNWRSYVFWIRATGSGTTNPLCDWSGTSADKYAQVHCIRGAIPYGDPFAASAWTDGTADPGVATGVTTTAKKQLVINLGIGGDDNNASVASTGTDPGLFINRHYSEVTTGADAVGWAQTAHRATAGATGTISNNFDVAAPVAWGVLVAAVLDAQTPADFPTTGILDAFTRADNASLGGNYTTVAFANALRIVSNQAQVIAGGGWSAAYWNPSTFGPDSEAYVDLVTLAAGWEVSCYVRGIPSAAIDLYTIDCNATTLEISKVVSTGTTIMQTATSSFVAGDKLGLRVIGDELAVYRYTGGAWGQAPVVTVWDTVFSAAGNVGFGILDGGTGTTAIDNFGGGKYITRPLARARRSSARPRGRSAARFS